MNSLLFDSMGPGLELVAIAAIALFLAIGTVILLVIIASVIVLIVLLNKKKKRNREQAAAAQAYAQQSYVQQIPPVQAPVQVETVPQPASAFGTAEPQQPVAQPDAVPETPASETPEKQ